MSKPHRLRRRKLNKLAFEHLERRTVLNVGPIITEFVASNDNSLDDGDGNSSDWVEIFNPTSAPIDLAGWHLTDKANNLDKWTFPNASQSVLDPGEYLIVFASGQDVETYIDPAGYLHTDFALSAGGEFLALTDPLENIVSAYSPEYPTQITDVSYGINTGVVNLIGDSSTATAFVPTSGSLDTGDSPVWTQIGYNDSGWLQSTGGPDVGFDTSSGNSAGPTNGTVLGGLVGGDLTDPEDDGTLAVSFAAGASTNSPTGEEPAKALDNSTVDSKWLAFTSTGTYYEMEFLDGLPRIVDGYTITSANDHPERDPYSWTLKGSNDGVNYTLVDSRDAQNFSAYHQTRLYEFVNINGFTHYRFDFQTEYGVTANNHTGALQMDEIELLSSQQFNLDALVDLDVESQWLAERSSIYQRVDFNVADPSALGAMFLDMQYNDGFVAYLNGQKVIVANSPAQPNWQSLASTEREDSDSFTPEQFNLSEFHDLLVSGTNVLSIHALNDNNFSSEMVSAPRLWAVQIDATPAEEFYFDTPTPGTPNGEGQLGFVESPEFSVEHGFYDAAFTLTLDTITPGAEIYYTTNGDAPTPETGILYSGASPILIDGTTVIKAGAFLDGYYDSTQIASSYFFTRDIVSQSYSETLAAGFPSSWGSVSPDYGIDPDVIGYFDSAGNSIGGDDFGGQYAATIQSDLLAIPTLSIVMDTDDLFAADGIYTNSTNGGIEYERATSVELIYPDGTEGFQVNAGIRMQGGAFRRHDLSKKHSFRLLFKDEYGPTKLDFPFFGEDAVDSFDTITLRMESNDGYAWNSAGPNAQYARDAFASRTLLDMGQVAPHGNRMHLYINGIYWGVYNPNERPDASFAAMYYGGDKDNWDAINDNTATDGNLDAWNVMVALAEDSASGSSAQRAAAYQQLQGNNPDGTNNPAYEDYLDVDNYIDYLLVNFYGGNQDWPHRNWYAARERGPDSTGFKFHSWDAEGTLDLFGADVYSNKLNADVEAALPYSYLKNNPEFQLAFADRVHRALFNDGALIPENAIERYEEILSEMEDAIVAESARWGDMHSSTPHTKQDWLNESQDVINGFLTHRTDIFVSQLRSAGLYPSLDAPVFSQHGGAVPTSGGTVSMTAPSGTTFYTLDGSDPRELGGAIAGSAYTSPVTVTPGVTLKARTYSGGDWSALTESTYTLSGDYDGDYSVTQDDYLVWRSEYGKTTSSPADGNNDGRVDAADYSLWRNHLGESVNLSAPAPALIANAPIIFTTADPAPAAETVADSVEDAAFAYFPVSPTVSAPNSALVETTLASDSGDSDQDLLLLLASSNQQPAPASAVTATEEETPEEEALEDAFAELFTSPWLSAATDV